MLNPKAQAVIRSGKIMRSLALGVLAIATLLVASAGPAKAANPALPQVAQSGSGLCRVNGRLVEPVVDAIHTYGWAFVANFDHPGSTTVTTCFAERNYGQPTRYTIANHCTAIRGDSTLPALQFGTSGVAQFNGNTYLSCTLSVPPAYPDIFYVRVRMIPMTPSPVTGHNTSSYTFLSSSAATFRAQTDAACQITNTSTYSMVDPLATFGFSHSATATCGSYVELGSRVVPVAAHTSQGGHKIGGSFYGPSSGNGRLSIPNLYTFNIGALGETYTLDWLFIDPTPQRSGA